MSDLGLARARAQLIEALGGRSAPRVASRRVAPGVVAQINAPDCAQMVRIAGDPKLKARMTLIGAAILNSNDIAASVSGPDRLALAELIDPDIRAMALASRALARTASGAKGADCAAKIRGSFDDIECAWAHLSPFEETPERTPDDYARLTAATEMAMSQLEPEHA